MKKNLRSCIEQPTLGERVDLFNPGDPGIAQAAGLLPDINHARTALWRFSERTCVRFPLNAQAFSAYRFFTFSVWAVGGAGGTFALRLESDENLGGKSGYTCLLPVTHNGWNDYRIELPFSGVSGEPLGWDFIRAVVLDCEIGGQNNRKETVLSIGQMSLWKGNAPQLYVKRPELKGAAVFSKTGSFAIVNRQRVPNAPDANLHAKPFEENGTLWLPMAPAAAVLGKKASADDRAQTLHFTYHRKAYRFGTQPFYMEDGARVELWFRPQFVNGTLFFPADFLCSFFHWKQIFRDITGLVILSNRKQIFNRDLEGPFIRILNSELTLAKLSGRQMLEDLHRRWEGSARDRLLLSHEGWMAIRRACKTDDYAALLLEELKAAYGKKSAPFRAKPIFSDSVEPESEKMQEASDRMISFGALWRLTGDKAFAERAAAEGEALAGIEWAAKEDPASAALAALAVSLCYDWCRMTWDEARKMKMERALLRGFLRPILETYGEKSILWRSSPETAARVYEGLTAAAFVLSDVFPETAIRALEKIVVGVPHYCISCYAPDGGFAEGAKAWQTCTGALAVTLAMFTSSCGSTYGMDSLPGFLQTALFGTVIETARGAWDPREADATRLNTSFLPWFAASGDDLPARLRRDEVTSGQKRPDVWDLLFWTAQKKTAAPAKAELPPDAVYRRAGLAVLRSGWDENATVLSLHGGCNAFDGVADAGSFGLECEGKTFFTGACALNLQNGKNAQSPSANAALIQARGASDRAFAVVDTEELAEGIRRGKRGVCLFANRTVAVIQDELTTERPVDLLWTAYTPATVLKKRRRSLILESDGKKLLCRIAGATAQFRVEPANVPGLTKLTIALRAEGKTRLAIACKAFSEWDNPNEAFYAVEPISAWGK